MPTRKKGESRNSYVGRCVPEVMGEGRTQKQAVGKCMGMAKDKKRNWERK